MSGDGLEEAWELVDWPSWSHSVFFAGHSFFTPNATGSDEDGTLLSLSAGLPGVRGAEDVLLWYEAAVGIVTGNRLALAKSHLLPSDKPLFDSKERWRDVVVSLFGSHDSENDEDCDDLLSPSMTSSGSLHTHRSTSTLSSVDLTDSDRSAAFSSMPSTPRASRSNNNIRIKASPSSRSSSVHDDSSFDPFESSGPFPIMSYKDLDPSSPPVAEFQFPSLDPPILELQKDENGFFDLVSRPGSKASSHSNAVASTSSGARSRVPSVASVKSAQKPRPISDFQFPPSREPVKDEPEKLPENSASDPTSSRRDSIHAHAERARDTFLAQRRDNKLQSVSPVSSVDRKGKGKARSRPKGSPVEDRESRPSSSKPMITQVKSPDGWIEFPTLSNPPPISPPPAAPRHRSQSRSSRPQLQQQGPHRRAASQSLNRPNNHPGHGASLSNAGPSPAAIPGFFPSPPNHLGMPPMQLHPRPPPPPQYPNSHPQPFAFPNHPQPSPPQQMFYGGMPVVLPPAPPPPLPMPGPPAPHLGGGWYGPMHHPSMGQHQRKMTNPIATI